MQERPRHGTWFAVGADADSSPELMRMREALGEEGDVYYYRLLAWCKRYRQSGVVREDWDVLVRALRFPAENVQELKDVLVRAGVGTEDGVVVDWWATNGWIVAKAERDRKRVEQKRRAGRASARARRKRNRQ